MFTKILGPPGCAKTTTLLQTLQEEIESGVPPERIAFLTFTRAARIEALTRTGKKDSEFPFLKTIHSICYHQLGISKEQIVTPTKVFNFGRKIGIKLTGAELDPWIEEFERSIDAPTKDDFLLQANHRGRHRKIMLKEAMRSLPQEIDYKYAVWFTNAYRDWKKIMGYLDYTDLLTQYVDYGKPLDIDVLFIDEAQDLSPLQWDVVNVLGANAKRKYACGDDDQAIFHWAGADSSVFQNLEADRVRVLDQSYRVSKAVHNLAMSIANRIKCRLEKRYLPTDSMGKVSEAGYLTDLNYNKKTFILFRNHYRGAVIAQAFRNESVPFIGRGSPLNSIDVRAGLFAFYSLVTKGEAPCDQIKRLMNFVPSDGKGWNDWIMPSVPKLLKEKSSLTCDQVFIRKPTLTDWFMIFSNLSHLGSINDYIRKRGLLAAALPKVEIMSIHQSKGREADTVIIDPEMSRAVWQSMINDPDDEHRTWYVAVTRAKEQVKLMMPDGNFSYRF
jgi:superfamily I DNA/RNA helicase